MLLQSRHFTNRLHIQLLSTSRVSPSSVTFKVSDAASSEKSETVPDNFAVLLFGFAGSSFKQLDKHSMLYNSLGYKTVSCILPKENIFHNDTRSVSAFSRSVLDKVTEEGIRSVVTVAFSNNGTAVYQHLVTQLTDQPRDLRVTGSVFDSGPGPAQLSYKPGTERQTPGRLFLTLAYLSVNSANGVSLRENLQLVARQTRRLTWDPSVSWCGHWLKHEDPGTWPVLFIYSEADKLIPSRWLDTVVGKNMERRRTESWRIRDANHVAALKNYPDKYRETVKTFLESCHVPSADHKIEEQ